MNQTLLLVGDPHCTAEEISDCENLLKCIVDAVLKERNKSLTVVFLGDLHHNHAIVHVDVIAFWRKAFKKIEKLIDSSSDNVVMIKGNHDAPTSGSQAHALMSYQDLDGITVVDSPKEILGIGYVPYFAEAQPFLDACSSLNTKTVICHQTFDGAQYENGFYAGDGIKPELVPQKHIISGHIHSPSEFSKVWYPGAPRWRTVSDANTDRAIWAVDFEDGVPVNKRAYPTGPYCKKIVKTIVEDGKVTEGPGLDFNEPNAEWHIDLKGSEETNKALSNKLARSGVHIRSFDTQNIIKARESEGIETSFKKFIKEYKPKYDTPISILEDMVSKRFLWK